VEPETLEVIQKIHRLLKDRACTLSVAESCTGGLVSHYVTTVPGASSFYAGGIVSYSEEMKKNIIGVSPGVLNTYGVVSGETAQEMAEKVRAVVKTDFSLATTGNLGPDVLEGKEKGLIYVAASREGKTVSRELRLTGNRQENKEQAAVSAFMLLVELMESEQE
jgi:PncC family amidohydrolase